ncbi:MAG: homoserine dehydrogenase [Campylobacteraceae bacterium]|nr:homoserine dehydrogenase [Campylobacteraceae bacterium]
MKKINIGLLGLGNIGTGTYKVLEMNRETIEESLGLEVEITKILEKDTDRDRGIDVALYKFTQDPNEIFQDSSVEIVIELLGGVEPASSLMISAMNNGKSVVTANKAAVAANFIELNEAADRNNVEFRYEASVGGGIPVLKAMSSVLRANEFSEVLGIVNGTTNYILTQMSDNDLPYETALKTAQELGFAEADPTDDVEGIDAANKLTILTALAFGDYIAPENIPTQGITNVTPQQIEAAKKKGNKIKLIARVAKDDGKITAAVAPMELPLDHPLCGVNNEFNAIYMTGNAVGELMFYGKGAGALPTGSAILGDVMDIIEWENRGEHKK